MAKLLNNQRVILYRWLLEAPSRRLRIQRRSFLWRTLSESGAGYILNNLHWEYDIIWPINMGISNIKILLNGVIWQNINYFMILSTIYWSNMSQRMRFLPEMLIGTLLSAEDSTCFPLRPLGVSWVCPGCVLFVLGSPVFSSRPQRQDNSDVDDAGWQSALPGLGGLCASLLLPLHVRCERMWTKRGNRGELSWKGLADVVHVSKAVSIRQRPLIWHKHTQWIVDTSQVWSGNWSQLNKYIYIIYLYPHHISIPFSNPFVSFHQPFLSRQVLAPVTLVYPLDAAYTCLAADSTDRFRGLRHFLSTTRREHGLLSLYRGLPLCRVAVWWEKYGKMGRDGLEIHRKSTISFGLVKKLGQWYGI